MKTELKATSASLWLQIGKNNWYAEVSELNKALKEKQHRRNQCPVCKGFFSKQDIVKIDFSGLQIQSWNFRCPKCRTHLIVHDKSVITPTVLKVGICPCKASI